MDAAINLLVFRLGGRRCALPASDVREVVRAVWVEALPSAPPIVEGVINFRGAIVPVLDVRKRFGIRTEPLRPDQHFVVAEAGPRLVCLRVDRATEVLAVDATAIEAAARSVPGSRYVAGVARLADGLLVIHDLAGFLALEEAERVDAALAQAR